MKKTEDYTLLNLLSQVSGRSDLNSVRGFASKFSPYSLILTEYSGSRPGSILRAGKKSEQSRTKDQRVFDTPCVINIVKMNR
jgi:hypothetical protein